jgi:hypothetical protein
MARKKNLLTYPAHEYFPEILTSLHSEKELRAEYTRMRDIAQKRIKRLLASEFSESQTAKKWAKGVPRLSDLRNKSDIAHGLSELSSFLESPFSTIQGQRITRAKQRATLEKRYPGLDLSGKKFDAFTRVMNAQVDNHLEKLFGSNRALVLFRTLKSKKVRNINAFISTPAKMAYWLQNVENLAAVELPKGKGRSAKNYKELVESEIKHGRDRSPITVSGVDDLIRNYRKGSNK